MPVVNPLARELVFKVVYYGPGLGGKTTTLQHIHATAKPEHRGKMVSLATPFLEDLSRNTGESAHFSVRMDDAVVVLARTGGKGAFQLNDRAGAVRPAHCTALGKIMLAALPVAMEWLLDGA